MKLKDFEIIHNKERPQMCYKYILKKDGLKFEISTLNYGKEYLATIEEHTPVKGSPHRYLGIFKTKIDFIEGPKEAIKQFKKYLQNYNP
jgi:hypothetical protein